MRIHDTLTRLDSLEYKEDNGEFLNFKVCLCAGGDQQISGVSIQESDLKSTEARLLLALVAVNRTKVVNR